MPPLYTTRAATTSFRAKRAVKLSPATMGSAPAVWAGCLLEGTAYFRFQRRPGGVDDGAPGLQNDLTAVREFGEVSADCFSKTPLDTIADNSIAYCATDGQSCLAGLPCLRLSGNSGKKATRPADALAIDTLELGSAAEAPRFGETCRTGRNWLLRPISRS